MICNCCCSHAGREGEELSGEESLGEGEAEVSGDEDSGVEDSEGDDQSEDDEGERCQFFQGMTILNCMVVLNKFSEEMCTEGECNYNLFVAASLWGSGEDNNIWNCRIKAQYTVHCHVQYLVGSKTMIHLPEYL